MIQNPKRNGAERHTERRLCICSVGVIYMSTTYLVTCSVSNSPVFCKHVSVWASRHRRSVHMCYCTADKFFKDMLYCTRGGMWHSQNFQSNSHLLFFLNFPSSPPPPPNEKEGGKRKKEKEKKKERKKTPLLSDIYIRDLKKKKKSKHKQEVYGVTVYMSKNMQCEIVGR